MSNSKAKAALSREIEAMESRLTSRKARKSNQGRKARGMDMESVVSQLESLVAGLNANDESFCGEGYMNEDEIGMDYMDEDVLAEEDVDFMDDSGMNYMNEDVLVEEDVDFMDDNPWEASEESPGIEDEITQDSLDDVLELRENPMSIDTDPTMLDTAPTGVSASKRAYVACLYRAEKHLDRIASHLEQSGNKKAAFEVDKISDAIQARIKKEVQNG